MKPYPDMYALFRTERAAKEYFDALPEYVQSQIATRAQNINSFESLRDYAENLLSGD